MTDSQWAERITALAKDRVKAQLGTFDDRMHQAYREFSGKEWYQDSGDLNRMLTWYLSQHPENLTPEQRADTGWLKKMTERHEEAIRAEMMAKLDIFGQLRKAKGEDWTPKSEAAHD